MVAFLVDRGERAVPDEVETDAVLVGVADEVQLLQRLHDLDPVRAYRGVQPVVVDLVRAAHHPLLVAAADGGVGVLDAEVRIEAEPGDEEGAAVTVVRVEIAAVVEVAVTRAHVGERERCLVQRVFVEWRRHSVP